MWILNMCTVRLFLFLFLENKTYACSRLGVFCKKGVLRNFSKFTGKHLCQSFFFNKVAGLRHRCFPVNFVKFPTTLFYRTPPVAASDQDSIVKLSANNKLLVVIFTSFGVCSWSSSVLLSLFKKSGRSFISRLKRRVLEFI